jgi:hypothetical protein
VSVIPALPTPAPIDYSSRDFHSVLSDLLSQIPNFLPEWTDRSPSDFGIALLELFAYQTDILNYYIDRVANEAFLPTAQQRQSVLNLANLLDYTPSGNVAATVSLLFTIITPSPIPVIIPAGTRVNTPSIQGASVTFETLVALTIWGDNTATTTLNAAGNGNPNQQFLLSGPYDGGPGITVTVGGVTYTRSIDDKFTGHSYTGASTVFIVVNNNIVQFGDGVAGHIPSAAIVIVYAPVGLSGGLGVSQYSASVLATQGISVNGEILGSSTGFPGQIFSIFGTPIIENSVEIFVDEGTGPIPWVNFNKLIDASPIDLAFSTDTTAAGIVQVLFGDGVNGRAPIPGAVITADYQLGGGVAGNVSSNTLTILSSTIQGVTTVTNPQAAFGGADAETVDHIRTHAPISLTAINRAVAPGDYSALAMNVPTIAKASAVPLSVTVMSLYIHPLGGFFSPSSGLDAAVAAISLSVTNPNGNPPGYLDNKKMAFVSIQVIPPKYHNGGSTTTGYVPIDISVSPLVVLPQYNQNSVKQAVISKIAGLLSFAVVNFGSRITLSSLYQAIQSVPGVAYGTVTVLSRHEIGGVGDVVCAIDEIPVANVITVTATGGLV